MTPEHIAKMKAAREAKGPRIPKQISHTVRTADEGTITFPNYSRAFAVRVHCQECIGWEGLVKDCTSPMCPLYPFRGGTEKTRRGE